MTEDNQPPEAIAVIGMSGRFPGAGNPDEFWQNLISGKDSVTRFPPRTGGDGAKYVGARSLIERPDLFDAAFFGIYPKEAALMDPQHRLFLECAWEALEHGACDPSSYPGMIGVFAGLSLNTYLLHNLGKAKELAGNYQVGEYQTMLGNDKDFLPVRVSYKLNLRGPSMAIQTACSTSLVAICQAATSLLTYQCDMALAGGVSISFPQKRDYLFTEEGMVSGEGAVRAFDEKADGTVFGHGCGVVLLKRLSEAIADRDPILAVIKGWAVNNDGSDKIGFAAPGLNAQADVIAMAQAAAGAHPSEISYIEAHGTGTPLGDPIEVAALTKAFREGGAESDGFCVIGTGKSNIGHLDVAAGVTGLIKTIQQFRHGKIPALLHFTAPNPRIDFANSPFVPAAGTRDWPRGEKPRLAGVSAFGVGGTNAHVVMEEAPAPAPTTPGRALQLFTLSAKTGPALDKMSANLADHLERHPDQDPADIAFTLATGRKPFPFRRHIVAADAGEAVVKLRSPSKANAASSSANVAFLFPGQGSQYPDMGKALYHSEPAFRETVDECAAILLESLGVDIRATLYPAESDRAEAEKRIHQTWITQPCIFVTEYALARLWMSWGVRPSLLIGHSIGEYVAAVLAGTFTLPDALALLAVRAKLMQQLPSGAMLAVRLGADELELPPDISLAAINSRKLCTVSGPHEAITSYQRSLEEKKIACRPLNTSHAFHSAMMESMVAPFTTAAAKVTAQPPAIPWISTCTGREMDAETLADPGYWARQLRHTVRFTDALDTAFSSSGMILLEVGPGQALAPFARQHPEGKNCRIISTLPSSGNDAADILNAAGELWKAGAAIDWQAFYSGQLRARLHLPTYPFERESHWIDRSLESENERPESENPGQPVPAGSPTPTINHQSPHPMHSEKLRALVLELSGISVDDDNATFTELGFDSLFLTQLSQAVQSRFGVKVTFRQMLGELSSISALSTRLTEQAPVAPPQATTPAVVPAVKSGSTIEQLMQNQILLMQELLAGNAGRTSAPSGQHSQITWPPGHPKATAQNNRFGPYKPLEKGGNGGLTATQRSALGSLISRYVSKTAASKAYAAEHRAHLADPRAVSGFKSLWKEMVYPIVSAGGKGSKIRDIDGNEYIDVTMGFGTYFFGHSPDWLIEAVEEQLKTGIEIGPQSPLAGKLARSICALTRQDRATFCNTGSEAVMAAMRLARTVTGRDRIAFFTGDYHGMFEEVLVRGSWIDGVYKAQPIAPGIPQSLVGNILVLDYADPASLEILRTHAHELAAVMVEPVQSRAPGLQPRAFMHELREITRASGSALIFDEIVTGFRCHPGGAQAWFGVEADLATYGKVIGGGMPIGVLAGKKEYMDALDGGAWNYGDDSFPETGMTFFAGTFVRHPLALAAAWRVVEHLCEEGPRLQIDVTEKVARFCRTLNAHFETIGVPIHLPHFSAHAVIEHAPELKHAGLLWYFLRERGIHIWEGRPLYFTTAHTEEDYDQLVRAFIGAVEDMQAAGFLPASSRTANAPDAFPRHETAPTTEAQREIFHGVQMGADANCSFNESNIIRLDGPLDSTALKAALADIIARHPALRSTFSEDGNHQHFHPAPREIRISEHDLTHAGTDELQRIKETECTTPFDLIDGPLVRLHLVTLPEGRHELIFTAHHLVCDGWSFGMILSELAAAYNARRQGLPPMLPPAMSFADYARMEATPENPAERQAAESWWMEKLSGNIPVLELPTDRPRPQLKSYTGAMETLTLEGDVYTRLKQSSPKLGGTLFATLLSSFATLLHRITGQDDLIIGVPAAGQTRVGCDELIGHCLNFLPLRLRADGTHPFRRFAADVKELVLEAYDHQECTFGGLLKKLTLPRDSSRLPLVSVMFNIDKSGIDRIHYEGLSVEVETNPKHFVNFDLFFNLVQTENRMVVECEYNTDLHDAATIRRWLGCFQALIESAIDDGDAPLDSLPMLSPQEKQLVLHDWNATARDYPRETTLHALVAETAAKHPLKTAVRCGEQTLSYGDLIHLSDALASRLQAGGVRHGDLVGIHLERSVTLIAGLLAILKCGAAYVPMDPAFPAERLRFMVEDAHMKVILSQTSLRDALPPTDARILLADEYSEDIHDFTPVGMTSGDTAYVIFTSGSTGRPKGVRIPHRAVVNFLGSMRREPGLAPDDTLLSVTTLSFDISGLEIFLPLTTGAETVIATRDVTVDGNQLISAISENNITVLQATPATWRLLLEAGWTGKADLKALVGGEAVPRELVNRLAPLCREIWNVYGPTETTIWSTACRLGPGEGPVSIGKPIDNTQVFIVNQALQPQPAGISGELLIGGDGLAEGYHELPDLTAERFIRTPLSPGKLYRTGDLARWLPDGTIECLGRMDHQVKVRGFRIELGEIETRLESHPSVSQAAAAVHDGRLVAYIRPHPGDGTSLWQDQWDLLYTKAIEQSGGGKLDKLDSVIAGWSGIDGIDAQVSEWIETTVDRIRSHGGSRVFEIGCGTGQLLARLAPECECYWAADISKVAIEALEKNHPHSPVKLLHRPADDFTEVPDAHFDTVIINSVAQYFPDAAYLRRVIEGAARTLRPGGRIFLGDIQSNALLPVHHAETLREREPAGSTCGMLREKIATRLARETELSLDPSWFSLLPGFAHTEIQLRRGSLVNETTVYHYDAILHIQPSPSVIELPEAIDWRNLNLEQLEAMLTEQPAALHLTGIPDARLASPLAFAKRLADSPDDTPVPKPPIILANAVSAEELFALADACGYTAHVRWENDGADGHLEAAFIPADRKALPLWNKPRPPHPADTYANKPAASAPTADPAAALRRHLAGTLPDYMIPSAFVMLDTFPLTPNGKVDRKALPAPASRDDGRASDRAITAPRNETETRLLEIWQQVLGKDGIGVQDDIFELGGDSILIFQMTTRANRAGLAVTPAQVFRLRTIAALAESIPATRGETTAPAIQRVNRDAYRRTV